MPGETYKKFSVGDPLEFRAAWMNGLTDVLARSQANNQPRSSGALGRNTAEGIICIRNDSGADRDRFDILGISGILTTPTENISEFVDHPMLTGVVPTADHLGKFVICHETISAGCIGKAWVVGTCLVKVDAAAMPGSSLDVLAGDATKLTASGGPAFVLYGGDDATGNHWALVRFGGSGGALSAPQFTYQEYVGVAPNQPGWRMDRACPLIPNS